MYGDGREEARYEDCQIFDFRVLLDDVNRGIRVIKYYKEAHSHLPRKSWLKVVLILSIESTRSKTRRIGKAMKNELWSADCR